VIPDLTTSKLTTPERIRKYHEAMTQHPMSLCIEKATDRFNEATTFPMNNGKQLRWERLTNALYCVDYRHDEITTDRINALKQPVGVTSTQFEQA
jgi:hypothetical protein